LLRRFGLGLVFGGNFEGRDVVARFGENSDTGSDFDGGAAVGFL
jgi:hypothetical protein